ncbi:hypothetical protein [Corynebacterium argentoratense]|uniref:hypothetical protein n=1 Tax=Corynebacterium argentoratense TaxID=42817 RepID=UPI000A8086FE|nr:hypothetical protein [Corynebacterium argentoratense]
MSKQHEEHVAHDTVADDATDTTQRPKGYTPPKGKPTPKRDRPHRGNTTPPMTRAEAKQRKKELKASMSKEEYKALQRKEREEASAERRRSKKPWRAATNATCWSATRAPCEPTSVTGLTRAGS